MRYYDWGAGAVVGTVVALAAFSAWPKVTSKITDTVDAMVGPRVFKISATGDAPEQRARFFAAPTPAPLIVDLHYWSADHRGHSGNDISLDTLAAERGWNFIRPSLAGPNDHPDACCSEKVIAALNSAISYAKSHGKVTDVYVVGGSGGGYTTLCAAMSEKVQARAYFAWVPITDLVAWHAYHAQDHYGQMIRQCTVSTGPDLNIAEAKRRSPYFMPIPQRMPETHLFAGITDGTGAGSVLPTQSVRFYNRFAAPASRISDAEALTMIDDREGPDSKSGRKIGDRTVHLYRSSGSVDLTVFEGGHEILARPTVEAIERDQTRSHRDATSKP